MRREATNRINLNVLFIIALSPVLSYFIVTFTSVKSGTYVFNALIALNCVVLLLDSYKRNSLVFPLYMRFLGLFTCYTIFSDIYFAGKDLSFMYLFKNQVLFGFLVALIVENTIFSRGYIKKMTKLLKILFWLSFVIILIQQMVDYNFLSNPNSLEELEASDEMERRLSSIYSYLGGSIYAGLTMIPVMSIIVAENLKRKKPVMIYYIAGALFSLINKSRWILVNLLAAIFARYSIRKTSLVQVFKIIAAVVIVSMGTYYTLKFFNFDVDEFVAERLLETNKGGLKSGAASTRLLAFEIFSEVYPDNPIWGKGNLNWGEGATGDKELKVLLKGRSSQIHVGFLSLFYWYGVAGTLPFLFFLYFMMKRMYKTASLYDYWGPYWGMFGFILANLTLVYFSINVPGLIFCLMYNKFYEHQWALNSVAPVPVAQTIETYSENTVS